MSNTDQQEIAVVAYIMGLWAMRDIAIRVRDKNKLGLVC